MKKLTFENATRKIILEVDLRENDNVYPYMDIDFQPCEKYLELSICGTGYWKTSYGSWKEDCGGQILSFLEENFTLDPNADPKAIQIARIWDRWHLNGLRAGCREQEDYLYNRFVGSTRHEKWRNMNYDTALQVLGSANLLTVKKGMTKYTYGHAWLVEKLPADVIAEVESW